jgi:hypothetical protein
MRNSPGSLIPREEIRLKIAVGSIMDNNGIYPPPIEEDNEHKIVALDAIELAALMSSLGQTTLVEMAAEEIERINHGS